MPTNAPFGFRPYRHKSGGLIRSREYPILSGYNTSIFSGDPVKLLNDGTIAQAAAGDRILGVFRGVQYVDASGSQQFSPFWPANQVATDIKAAVVDDPQVTFEAQSAGTPTQANVGELTDHVVNAGSAFTGQSGCSLNAASGTGAAGFRILDLIKKPGNSGQFASLEVSVYEHEHSIDEPATPGV